MRSKSKKKLSHDDRLLWKKVVSRVERLDGQAMLRDCEPLSQISVIQTSTTTVAKVKPFQIGQTVRHRALSIDLQSDAIKLDRKTLRRIKRGTKEIDGKLDLHGYKVTEAETRMHSFIRHHIARGSRLLLVVTGKGLTANKHAEFGERGVLRKMLPIWLGHQSMSSSVINVTPASNEHGGSGAYYVFLRKHP